MTKAAQSEDLKPAEPFVERTAPATIRVERLLPGPIERVWSYLVDSDKRAKWFAGGPMELRMGGAVELSFRNYDLSGGRNRANAVPPAGTVDHVMVGIVTQCEPPHLLAFNWSADGSGSEAIFELTQEGPDTRMIVTHRNLSSHKQLLGVSAGWHTHIGILIDLLSETPARAFWPEHVRLEGVYSERFPE